MVVSATKGICGICLESKELNEYRVFIKCGHGCCKACLDRLLTGPSRGKCHICMQAIGKDYIQVFLEIEDPKIVLASFVAGNIHKMDKDSKLVSVRTTPSKVESVMEKLKCDNGLAQLLLDAVGEFRERIIPLFEQVKAMSKLKVELEEKTRNNESLTQKHEVLHRQAATYRQERDHALQLAEAAKNDVLAYRSILTALEDTAKRVDDLSRENMLLRGQVHELETTASRNKHQIKGLKQEIKTLEAQSTLMETTDRDVYMEPQIPSSSHTTVACDYEATSFEFEGMPAPGRFGANWTLPRKAAMKKRKLGGNSASSTFPIPLDAKGRPQVPVQQGPKKTLRIPQFRPR